MEISKRQISDLYHLIMGKVQENLSEPYATLTNFHKNYNNLKQAKGKISDKEAHALANCQSAQCQGFPTVFALDYGREFWDVLRKNTWDKGNMSFRDTIKDSKRDLEANNYGLLQGLLHPFADCNNILDRNYLRGLNK